ncbi:AMP-binding protein [Azorhizophilus paspali]|uniref:AMP-binding protein n=1 Tax=Azorhizophilus paspali TaxID=69963 RepID=UPI0037494269
MPKGGEVDDRIFIALDDGPELAIIFFAALAMGALPVVLNPKLDSAAILQLVTDARPTLCFVQPDRADQWAGAPGLHILETGAHQQWLTRISPNNQWQAFALKAAEAPVLIQYTSGSTGQPKGVLHSARSILACCEDFAAGQLGLDENDVLYSVPKTFFGYGMGNSLFFPLYVGASAVLDRDWPSAQRVRILLAQYRPSVMFAVPTLYGMLLEESIVPNEMALRLAFSAGAPLPPNIARRWQQRFGISLHDGIGATELGHVFATSYPDAQQPGKVGRMLPGWQSRIVNALGQDVIPGECGVMLVKAPGMAVGYWERPDDQALRFKDGWYRTGDLFSQDAEGMLSFHGREDDRFKVFGRWVVPVEVENLLISWLPELYDCYLVAGCTEDECRPVLFMRVPEAANDLTQRVEGILQTHLESYKRPVRIVRLEEIPVNRNGKPDRRELAYMADQLLRFCTETQEC